MPGVTPAGTPTITPFELVGCPGTPKLRVTIPLDRETVSQYTVRLQVVDKGATPRTGVVDVTVNVQDINDNDPICDPAVVNPLRG